LKYKIKLIAIAKDEAAYLAEWIHHHLYFGVDAIHIAINNTTDGSTELLDKLGRDFPVTYSIEDELYGLSSHTFQGSAYRKMATQAKEEGFTHVLMLDIDEFWVARDFQTSIKQAIDQIGEADSYLFNWFFHCDEGEFAHCFKTKVLGQSSRVIKNLLNLSSPYTSILVHNSVGPLQYKTADGKEYLFEKDDMPRASLTGKVDLKTFPFIVVHRTYRSQMEYVSLLTRGRAKGDLIKNNRQGYYEDAQVNDEIVISEDLLCNYYASFDSMVEKTDISSDIEDAKRFVEERYLRSIEIFNRKDLSLEDQETLTKVLKNVTLPDVAKIVKKVGSKKPINHALESKEIDLIRDLAIKLESSDLQLSLDLMKVAHKLRPQGKFIKKKLELYEAKLKG